MTRSLDIRGALVRWLERRRDAAFARAIQWPLGSLGDEENMCIARGYELLAMGLRRSI